MTSPSQHIAFLRHFINREMIRRERDNRNLVGAFPTVEEARAAIDSLDELAVALHTGPTHFLTHVTQAKELTP